MTCKRRVASCEKNVQKSGNKAGRIDVFWPGTLLVEQKSRGKDPDAAFTQGNDYFQGLSKDELHDLLKADGLVIDDMLVTFDKQDAAHRLKVRCAFVSTNSITQGEQVVVLWGRYCAWECIFNFRTAHFEESRQSGSNETKAMGPPPKNGLERQRYLPKSGNRQSAIGRYRQHRLKPTVVSPWLSRSLSFQTLCGMDQIDLFAII